jgi:acetyl esterase
MYDAYPNYKDGVPDGEVAAFLEGLASGGPSDARPLSELTPQEVRRSCDISAWIARRDAVERKADVRIPGPAGPLPLRVYVPEGAGPFPVLIYFHGGGWVFGSLDEADQICSALALRTPCLVVSVGYRLSPEAKYPAALEDARAAASWVGANIGAYGGDPRFLAVAGESAGANIATVLCRIARDEGGPQIAYQLLLCPWTNLVSFDTASCRHFGEGPWLPRRNLEYYRAQYLGDLDQALEPDASPLLTRDLRGLPPAHVVTAEFDALRDDGESYAERLRDAGVPVSLDRNRGMIHSFFVLNGVISRAERVVDDCASRLREGFALSKKRNEAATEDRIGLFAPAAAAEGLMLYGRFVGDWEFDNEYLREDGRKERASGEWRFDWALEGRAVVDVWTYPRRSERALTGAGPGGLGVTVRTYDADSETWNIAWSAANGRFLLLIGRLEGEEIVQEGREADGRLVRWIFSEITDSTFTWRSESSADEGKTWTLAQVMKASRSRPSSLG